MNISSKSTTNKFKSGYEDCIQAMKIMLSQFEEITSNPHVMKQQDLETINRIQQDLQRVLKHVNYNKISWSKMIEPELNYDKFVYLQQFCEDRGLNKETDIIKKPQQYQALSATTYEQLRCWFSGIIDNESCIDYTAKRVGNAKYTENILNTEMSVNKKDIYLCIRTVLSHAIVKSKDKILKIINQIKINQDFNQILCCICIALLTDLLEEKKLKNIFDGNIDLKQTLYWFVGHNVDVNNIDYLDDKQIINFIPQMLQFMKNQIKDDTYRYYWASQMSIWFCEILTPMLIPNDINDIYFYPLFVLSEKNNLIVSGFSRRYFDSNTNFNFCNQIVGNYLGYSKYFGNMKQLGTALLQHSIGRTGCPGYNIIEDRYDDFRDKSTNELDFELRKYWKKWSITFSKIKQNNNYILPKLNITNNGTVLHCAANYNCIELVRYLLDECEFDPNYECNVNDEMKSAIDVAALECMYYMDERSRGISKYDTETVTNMFNKAKDEDAAINGILYKYGSSHGLLSNNTDKYLPMTLKNQMNKNNNIKQMMEMTLNSINFLVQNKFAFSCYQWKLVFRYLIQNKLFKQATKMVEIYVNSIMDGLMNNNIRDDEWIKKYILKSTILLVDISELLNYCKSQNIDQIGGVYIDTLEKQFIESVVIHSLPQDIPNVLKQLCNDEKPKKPNTSYPCIYFILHSRVKKLGLKQKQEIGDAIGREEKTNKNDWNALIEYPEYKPKKLRQDNIPNGLKSYGNEIDFVNNIDSSSGVVTNSLQRQESWNDLRILEQQTSFDPTDSLRSSYLSRLLVIAHSLDETFQNDMKQCFKNLAPKAKFQHAPIKLFERAKSKAETDYINDKFPQTASVIDFNRCSVTVDSPKELLDLLDKFQATVENKKAGCVTEILRIKNGFNNCNNWNNYKDCDYCDIKFNVLIQNKDKNMTIIGEIQFLLKWMLQSKKKCHKHYRIERDEYIILLTTMLMKKDKNDDLKQNNITSSIDRKTYDSLATMSLCNPFKLAAMRTTFGVPLLLYSNDDIPWIKGCKLLLETVKFASLHVEQESNKSFLFSYLNNFGNPLLTISGWCYNINKCNNKEEMNIFLSDLMHTLSCVGITTFEHECITVQLSVLFVELLNQYFRNNKIIMDEITQDLFLLELFQRNRFNLLPSHLESILKFDGLKFTSQVKQLINTVRKNKKELKNMVQKYESIQG